MKKAFLRLVSIFSVTVITFGLSAVVPTFDGGPIGAQQANAAQKDPSIVVKRDSKGRKISYKKTTYYANGKKNTVRSIKYNWDGSRKASEKITKYAKTGKKSSARSVAYDWSGKRKETETVTKFTKAGKKQQVTKRSKMKITGDSYFHAKTVVTKYSSSGKITSRETTTKYMEYPYALKSITSSTYKNGKLAKSVVSKYANRPSFVPKSGETITSNEKVTLEAGFLLDKNEYTYGSSGKKTLAKVWSPTHGKLVTPSVKKKVTNQRKQEKLVQEAKKLLGNPYREGPSGATAGKGPYSFDCSGYIAYVYYKALNVELPTAPLPQSKAGKSVTKKLATEKDLAKLEVGDILYFDPEKTGGIDHTAIYIGADKAGKPQFIESTRSRSGKGGVQITNFTLGQRSAPTSATRVIE